MTSPTESVSVRPMRLKVLYTFDTESKNNCLARWPHVLEIQTAFVDDLTQIGVIDLKICLQALTSSSPELLSQDDVDYTIYAYDYSEEGTPLSGQGMLSSVFHPDNQIDAADISAKVITGRVTKNVLGLFSGNGQETLEVKLRLLPIAKRGLQRGMPGQSTQLDYIESNQQSIDLHEWSNLMSNDNGPMYTQQSAGSRSPHDRTGLESVQRILHEGSVPRELSANRSSASLRASSNSRPGTRAGTPGHVQPFNPPARQSFSQPSRPSSRASARGASQPMNQHRRESFNSGYYSGDEIQIEDGPARKRAKVTHVGAPSRSDLNIERQPESLRMAASTASSVRVHRPVALNPALSNLQGSNFTDEPVRPPTPIPGAKKPGNSRPQIQPSNLRPATQQYSQSNMSYPGPLLTDATSVTTPEFNQGPSISSTPANIPSSPPVMTNYGSMPSSPMLPPPHPDQLDSGFVDTWDDMINGKAFTFDHFIDNGDHTAFHLQSTVEQGAATTEMKDSFTPASEEGTRFDEEVAKGTLPPPKPSNQFVPSKRKLSRAQSSRPAIRPGISSPKLAPAPYPRARQLEEEMAAQPSLPPVAASDPVGHQLQRSNTWAGEMSDVQMSDALSGDTGRAKSGSKKKVGREQTKARLENALARSEMPPYCDNCGTIDTPAWRRVFARTLPGHLYESVQLWPETPGAFVWKQVEENAEDGTIKTFKAYKLSKSPDDLGDEWANVTLCNPCGLWFHKNKCMRPEEKWTKNPKDPNQKKKRAYRPKSKRVAAKKGQEDGSKSDAPDPGSEGSSPAEGAATEAELEVEDDRQRLSMDVIDPQLRPMHGRATSAEPTMTATKAAATHDAAAGVGIPAIQSSPIRHEGSHSHPVQIDSTPRPLRRQLFPSPPNKTAPHNTSPNSQAESMKEKAVMPLSELPNSCRRSPRLKRSTDVLDTRPKTPEPTGKENVVSGPGLDDDLDGLFNDDDDFFGLPPQTPTPTRRSDRLLSKACTRTPSGSGRHVRTPGARTSPNSHQASQEVKTPKRDFIMGSNRTVEEMTPCTRLIHFELVKENAAKIKAAAAQQARITRHPPAQQSELDFVNLPSLSGMSPMPRQHTSPENAGFSGANMGFADMFPTDPPNMSSPPDGYYNFLNADFPDASLPGGGWDGAADMNALGDSLVAMGTTGLRRSPRKNKLG